MAEVCGAALDDDGSRYPRDSGAPSNLIRKASSLKTLEANDFQALKRPLGGSKRQLMVATRHDCLAMRWGDARKR